MRARLGVGGSRPVPQVAPSLTLTGFFSSRPPAITMAARRPRATTSGPSRSQGQSTMAEALTRLGITPEQFQAKQAELLTGLLQSEPFVPQATGTRQAALCDRSKVGEISGARSRSSSPSSSSSRALSPVLPRTPMKPEPVVPPRPRDKMEMIIESRNKLKATQRRG